MICRNINLISAAIVHRSPKKKCDSHKNASRIFFPSNTFILLHKTSILKAFSCCYISLEINLSSSTISFWMIWWRRTIKTRLLFKSSSPLLRYIPKFILRSTAKKSRRNSQTDLKLRRIVCGLSINKDFFLLQRRSDTRVERRKKRAALKGKRCVYYTFFYSNKMRISELPIASGFINFLMLFTEAFFNISKRLLYWFAFLSRRVEY